MGRTGGMDMAERAALARGPRVCEGDHRGGDRGQRGHHHQAGREDGQDRDGDHSRVDGQHDGRHGARGGRRRELLQGVHARRAPDAQRGRRGDGA
eukprot:2231961-Pyramimonas_sp.AAC.1